MRGSSQPHSCQAMAISNPRLPAGSVLVFLANSALPGLRLAIGVDNGKSVGMMRLWKICYDDFFLVKAS